MNTKIKQTLSRFLWVIPVVIGFALRIFDLTKSSIWHDEGYTMWLLRYDFMEIIGRTARDVHPPAYYLIAKSWVNIFGNSAFSIRFLSLIFSVGIILLAYKIVEKLVSQKAAYWSSLFVAFSPFLVKFGQEARMYGVVAFFTTLATYYFVLFVKDKKSIYLIPYTLSMIVAMYTQYYSFFVIISLWLILAIYTPEFYKFHWIKGFRESIGVFDYRWWLANISLLILYLPWFPVAYKQVTRVGGSYWIKPEWMTIRTIPGNVSQFITYSHLDSIFYWNGAIGAFLYWIIIALLIGSGVILFIKKDYRKLTFSFYIFGYLPMLLVFTLSKLRAPIYQDRYFPFSAIAIFVIWGCTIAIIKNNKIRAAFGSFAILVMILGIVIMHSDVNHQMKQITDQVKSHKQSSDVITSGSLYTFLDSNYYFGYQDIKLISRSVDGYGETSLFYDHSEEYMINPNDIALLPGDRVWVIGRSGEDYISGTPLMNWHKSNTFESGSIVATLYTR